MRGEWYSLQGRWCGLLGLSAAVNTTLLIYYVCVYVCACVCTALMSAAFSCHFISELEASALTESGEVRAGQQVSEVLLSSLPQQ